MPAESHDNSTGNAPRAEKRDTAWALWVLAGLGLIVSTASFSYGLLISGLSEGLLALLATSVGFGVGGLAGFLFGFPRYTASTAVSSAEDLNQSTNGEGNRRLVGPSENTNLERIVDWLTTMVVGATLVNVTTISAWSEERFRALTFVITGYHSAVPAALMVIPCLVGGFLFVYLWARRYLLDDWVEGERLRALVHREIGGTVKREVQSQTQDLKQDVTRLSSTLYRVASTQLSASRKRLASAGVDSSTIEDIINRYRKASTWEDEPLSDFGPAETPEFRFRATVSTTPFDGEQYEIHLSVESIDGAAWKGTTFFLIHNTYDEPIVCIEHEGAVAELVIGGEEAFWCAAVVVRKQDGEAPPKVVRLGLDLAMVKDAPKGFLETS